MSDAIQLPARLDLPGAVALVNDLRDRPGPICLDAAEVTHLGALGLQALVAISRHVTARGDGFEITNASDKFTAHMEIMGASPDSLMEGTA